MKKVGIVGWRGMVGSVLMDRMNEEEDFSLFEPVFFSTSNAGGMAPDVGHGSSRLQDAHSIEALSACDLILTCQGGDYTKQIHPALRESGWDGYWIDAASTLRMNDDSVIVLDPVNRHVIDQNIATKRDFTGGNCTVSLLMLAIHGLLKEDLVEWISVMSYQAASGGGAKHMRELLNQMGALHESVQPELKDPRAAILEIDRKVTAKLHDSDLPTEQFGVPLAGSLIPWIDSELPNGQSREEWKAIAEANKILGLSGPTQYKDDNRQAGIPIDGTCVRIGAMRSHAQGVTLKLKKDLPIKEIESLIDNANQWVNLIPNKKNQSAEHLTPAAISGTLKIPVGRVRKMAMGDEYLNLFTCGDQLLWGAAEPLRRVLRILLGAEV